MKRNNLVGKLFSALLCVVLLLSSMSTSFAISPDNCPGHKWKLYTASEDADCVTAGNALYICTICGDYKDEMIYGDHSWGKWRTTRNATCEKEGKRERTCSRCGKVQKGNIDKKAHTWGEWVIVVKPTRSATGLRERVCGVCGAKQQEKLYPDGTLKRGDRGEAVKDLQQALNDSGYNSGKPDGIFGPNTENAVKDYEKDNGMEPDGIAWPAVIMGLSRPNVYLDKSVKNPPANDLFFERGETITYRLQLYNESDVAITDIEIVDPLKGGNEDSVVNRAEKLEAGSVFTCEFAYVVTDADVAAGTVVNQASAMWSRGSRLYESNSNTVTVPTRMEENAFDSYIKVTDTAYLGVEYNRYFKLGEILGTDEFEMFGSSQRGVYLYELGLQSYTMSDSRWVGVFGTPTAVGTASQYNFIRADGGICCVEIAITVVDGAGERNFEQIKVTDTAFIAEDYSRTFRMEEIVPGSNHEFMGGHHFEMHIVGELGFKNTIDNAAMAVTYSGNTDVQGYASDFYYVISTDDRTGMETLYRVEIEIVTALRNPQDENVDSLTLELLSFEAPDIMVPGSILTAVVSATNTGTRALCVKGIRIEDADGEVVPGDTFGGFPEKSSCLEPNDSFIITINVRLTVADNALGEVVRGFTLYALPRVPVDGESATQVLHDAEFVSNTVRAQKDIGDPPMDMFGSLSVDKRVIGAPANGEFYVEGETIRYEIVYKNEGSVGLGETIVYDQINYDEPVEVASAESLAPGEERTCTYEHVVTAQDVENGSVLNTAVVESCDALGYLVNSGDEVQSKTGADETENPEDDEELIVEKAEVSVPANGEYYVEGETIRYEITC